MDDAKQTEQQLVTAVAGSSSAESPSQSGDIKKIEFRWTVKRVSDIDTSKQRFYCEFTLKLKWKCDKGKEEDEARKAADLNATDMFSWSPSWMPEVSFPNALDVQLDRVNIGRSPFFSITKQGDDYWIIYDMEIRAMFMEYFELKNYPFDCQDLTIIVKLGNAGGVEKYRLIPDESTNKDPNFAKIDLLYSVFSEWLQHPSVIGLGCTDPSQSKKGGSYPIVYCRLKIQRKYAFYIKRMCLILALLQLSSLGAFALNTSAQMGERMGLVVTLLLAVVAFQFSINDKLPVVSFLTNIDVYMLMTFVFIFLVGVATVVIDAFWDTPDDEDAKDLNLIVFFAFAGAWIAIHVFYLFYVPRILAKEKQKLNPANETFEQSLKNTDSTLDGVIAHHFAKPNEAQLKKVMDKEWAVFAAHTIRHRSYRNKK